MYNTSRKKENYRLMNNHPFNIPILSEMKYILFVSY